MRLSILRVIAITSTLFVAQSVWALSIISPRENQVFYAGSRVDVIVKPDAGEKWERVLLGIYPMSYGILSGEYKETIEIPADELGTIAISVLAVDAAGREVELLRNVISKMPPNVVLQSIMVSEDILILYIAPPGSTPEDKDAIELDQLGVAGIYSDGVKRYIASSAMGTTYYSSDNKVVTINSDGRVRSQGIGRAKITVRNGKYAAEVTVIVKPYSK
jgi:hypothetical protein